MGHRKLYLLIFLLLTAGNVLIFFYRDAFRYQSFATYNNLYKACNASCREKWSAYVRDFPAHELEAARRISDSFPGNKSSTIEKIRSAGLSLLQNFHHRLGTPTPQLLAASPLQQYKSLVSNDTQQLWCGNLAQMFSLFCWSQDIVCRNIEIANPGDHHVLNECYLPESRQWVLVDLTNNVLALEKDQQQLNFLDVKKAVRAQQPLVAWRMTGDSVSRFVLQPDEQFLKAYYGKDLPIYFYHSMDVNQVYLWKNKVRAYLLPVSWYDIYRENKGSNLPFYFKLLCIVLWIASFFVFLGSRKKLST